MLALRENYLDDMKDVHDNIGMRYVYAFHAIFHDENGVYDEDQERQSRRSTGPNVDQIYDGLLARGSAAPLWRSALCPTSWR